MRAMLSAVAATLAVAAPAQAAVEPEYFTLPADAGVISTTSLAVDGTGAVFFGVYKGSDSLLGRLDPAQARAGTADGVTTIPMPPRTSGSGVVQTRDVVYNPVSKLVFAARSDGKVVRWDGSTASAATVSDGIDLWGAAPTLDGGVWVAEHGARNAPTWAGNRLSRVSSSLGVSSGTNIAFQPGFDELHYDAKPRGVAVAPDGTPWFTQYDLGHGYRIATPGGAGYAEYRPVCKAAEPICSGQSSSGPSLYDVTVAPDGAVWYTNGHTFSIGRLVPGVSLAEYRVRDLDATLGDAAVTAITTSPDGTLWVATGDSPYLRTHQNALIQLDPATLRKLAVYKLGATVAPNALGTDAKGNVYFTGASAQPVIGRLAVGGTVITDPPVSGGGGGGDTPAPVPAAPILAPGPAPAPLTPAATSGAQVTQFKVSGDSLSANQVCVGPPQDKCSVIYLLQTREYVKGFPGAHSSAAKWTTIGKATVTLSGGQSRKVTVKLNGKGRKLRKKLKSFKATLTVTQTVKGAKKPTQLLKKNVTFKRG